jgi:hypothetical protein
MQVILSLPELPGSVTKHPEFDPFGVDLEATLYRTVRNYSTLRHQSSVGIYVAFRLYRLSL